MSDIINALCKLRKKKGADKADWGEKKKKQAVSCAKLKVLVGSCSLCQALGLTSRSWLAFSSHSPAAALAGGTPSIPAGGSS